MTTACLGGEIEVPTIDGKKARVALPDGTQTGKQFRLRGKGMPAMPGMPGFGAGGGKKSKGRSGQVV